ncbi:hypothetical protein [Desulfatitalea alkaliphila]|uniref:Uncharacterized protein n=1 Tax=Desulfatitalea alkaliphila TaxID=2929485 RepID=A0AA41R7J8_9BACT|nr:hypothetical protein [Desulfatitalea alkaliphila]MCJ8502585.1 hypothetical protein [Desulfatitalea alkaliphila]
MRDAITYIPAKKVCSRKYCKGEGTRNVGFIFDHERSGRIKSDFSKLSFVCGEKLWCGNFHDPRRYHPAMIIQENHWARALGEFQFAIAGLFVGLIYFTNESLNYFGVAHFRLDGIMRCTELGCNLICEIDIPEGTFFLHCICPPFCLKSKEMMRSLYKFVNMNREDYVECN